MAKSKTKFGAFIKDLGKGVAKIVASPVNAITGHEYNPKPETKFGKALEKVADFQEDVIGSAVNTGTFGLAKKVGLADGQRETKAGVIVGSIAGIAGISAGALALTGGIAGGGFSVKGGLGVLKGLGGAKTAISGATAVKSASSLINTKQADVINDAQIKGALEAASSVAQNPALPSTEKKGWLGSVIDGLGKGTKGQSPLDSLLGQIGLKKAGTNPTAQQDNSGMIWIVVIILGIVFLFKK